MISSTQMRPGMVIKFNNELFSDLQRDPPHARQPARIRAGASMRNLRSGSMIEHRFSSEDKVENAPSGRARDGVSVRRRRVLLLHEHRELRADAPDEGSAGRRRQLPDSAASR